MKDRVECTVCGIEKREEDTHWKITIRAVGGATRVEGFWAFEWEESLSHDELAVFACGEQHALILFERWLATKTFESGPQKTAVSA